MGWFSKKKSKAKNSILIAVVIAASYSGFNFGSRSISHLYEVCPPLIQVSECAIKETTVDFMIIDGMRTDAEHAANIAKGVSWVKRSLHQDGLAIDFVAIVNGEISWNPDHYLPVVDAYKKCGVKLDIPIVAGADWRAKDYGHIELKNRVCFPKDKIKSI